MSRLIAARFPDAVADYVKAASIAEGRSESQIIIRAVLHVMNTSGPQSDSGVQRVPEEVAEAPGAVSVPARGNLNDTLNVMARMQVRMCRRHPQVAEEVCQAPDCRLDRAERKGRG